MKKVITTICITAGLMGASAGATYIWKDMQIKQLNDSHNAEVADLQSQHNSEIKNIELDTTNVKKQYMLTEEFTSAGLKVNAIYKDGSKAELTTGYTIDSSLFDSNDVDSFSINVSYDGLFQNYIVEVLKPDSVTVEINDTKGFVGQSLDSLQPVVKAVYNNGGTPIYKTISKYNNYDYKTDSEGNKTFKFYAYGKEASVNLEVVSHANYVAHIKEKLANHLTNSSYDNTYCEGDSYIEYVSSTGCYAKQNQDESWIDFDGKSYTKSVSADYDEVVDFGDYETAIQEELAVDSINTHITMITHSLLNKRTTDFGYNEQNNTIFFEDDEENIVIIDYDTGRVVNYGGIDILYNYNFDIPSKDGIDFNYHIEVETNKLRALLLGQSLADLDLKVYSVSGVDGTKTEVTNGGKVVLNPSTIDLSSTGTHSITCTYRGRSQTITFSVMNEADYIDYIFEKGYAEAIKYDVISYEHNQSDSGGIAYVSDHEFVVSDPAGRLMMFTGDENNELINLTESSDPNVDGFVYTFDSVEDRTRFMFGENSAKSSILDSLYGCDLKGATCQIVGNDIIITIIDSTNVVTYRIDKRTLLIYQEQCTYTTDTSRSYLSSYQYGGDMPSVSKDGLSLSNSGVEYIVANTSGNIYVLQDATIMDNLNVFYVDADGAVSTIQVSECTLVKESDNKYYVKYGELTSNEIYIVDDSELKYSIVYETTKEKKNLDNIYYSSLENGQQEEIYWGKDTFYAKLYMSSTEYSEYWIDSSGKLYCLSSDGNYICIQYNTFEDAVSVLMTHSSKEMFYNKHMQQFNTMILEMEFYNIAVVDDICTITNTVSGKTTIVVIDLHTESLMHVSYTDSTDSSEVELKANVDNYSIPEIPTNID